MISSMQQSTLNKVRSLDYTESSSKQQQQSSQVVAKGAIGGRQLQHSVSIVVELAGDGGARDGEPVSTADAEMTSSKDWNREGEFEVTQEDKLVRPSCSQSQREDDEDDDEDEEDEDECLSSKLTRKLVVVDEADKILRSREARSAGRPASLVGPASSLSRKPGPPPSALNSRPRGLSVDAAAAAQLRAPLRAPPIPPRALTHRQPEESAAASPREPLREECPLVGGIGTRLFSHYRKGSQSGSELAERGELVRLSMRRNTHHFAGDSRNQGQRSGGLLASAAAADGDGDGDEDEDEDDDFAPGSDPDPAQQVAAAQLEGRGSDAVRLLTKSPTTTRRSSVKSTSGNSQKSAREQQDTAVDGSSIPSTGPTRRALNATTSSSSISGATNHFAPASSISSGIDNRNWSQRRQSLQISLLTSGRILPAPGGAGKQVLASGPASRSLTEEELRGEREFNEQVRSITAVKSPLAVVDLSATQGTGHFRGASLAAEARSKSADNKPPSWPFQQRQHSQSPCSPSSDNEQQLTVTPTGRSLKHAAIVPSSPHKQPIHQPASVSTATTLRRVSFSSVDPACCASLQSRQQNQRASLAFISPTAAAAAPSLARQQPEKPQARQQVVFNQQVAAQNQLQPQSQLCSTNQRRQFRPKRHSIATENSAHRTPEHPIQKFPLLNTSRRISLGGQSVLYLESHQNKTNEPMDLATTTSRPQEASDKITFRNSEQQQSSESSISSLDGKSRNTVTSNNMDSLSNTPTTTNPNLVATTVHVTEAPPGTDCSRVQSIMANAKLRQEEFARLLEEHEQIVNEINRVETKISSSSHTNLQQQHQEQQDTNKE